MCNRWGDGMHVRQCLSNSTRARWTRQRVQRMKAIACTGVNICPSPSEPDGRGSVCAADRGNGTRNQGPPTCSASCCCEAGSAARSIRHVGCTFLDSTNLCTAASTPHATCRRSMQGGRGSAASAASHARASVPDRTTGSSARASSQGSMAAATAAAAGGSSPGGGAAAA